MEHPADLTPETGGMLVSREEMRFDFGGAKFRLPRDASVLKWIFDQFLYGEVTGIQCGHWLYRAPSLEAATFFARQAVEELSHVRQFLRIYELIGERPGPAHRVIRFMATGSMGTDYAEHVATEMAVGEGLVLMIFYALIDTIEDQRVVKILESAARQEERHVAFGERQTQRLVAHNPRLASYLLGLNLGSILAMKRLARFVASRLGQEHEVLGQAPAFLDRLVAILELRLQRMHVLSGRISDIGPVRRAWLIATAYLRHWIGGLRPKPKLLTRTYLEDPSMK
ncbi:MAG TPA: ferritin-like domain-containing protein [Myxococcaceae bacterium]|nr:ferritin-like domain-containing protein [Myxococcaceae bacterium]